MSILIFVMVIIITIFIIVFVTVLVLLTLREALNLLDPFIKWREQLNSAVGLLDSKVWR